MCRRIKNIHPNAIVSMLCGSHIMQPKLDCEVHVSIIHVYSQNTHKKKSLSSAMAHKKELSQYTQISSLDYQMNKWLRNFLASSDIKTS